MQEVHEEHPKGSFLATLHEALVHTLQDPEEDRWTLQVLHEGPGLLEVLLQEQVYPEVLVRQRLIEVLLHEGLELLEERHGPLGEQEELQNPEAAATSTPWLSRVSRDWMELQMHL